MARTNPKIETAIPSWPAREREAHKGDFGRVLLIGGSRGMAGAIALSGMAALRAGAGLVTVATADRCLETVASFHPAYMTIPLADDTHGMIADPLLQAIAYQLDHTDALAVGPGLGRSASLREMVTGLYRALPRPLVVDADGLFALSPLELTTTHNGAPRVLTPHLGEFERLVGQEFGDRDSAEAAAMTFAAEHRVTLVLKGAGTLVTDGSRAWRAKTGNPGMASGGMGDALTGILAALLAQGFEPWQATTLGVHIHGLAGDFAAREFSPPAMTAVDLIEHLPDAIKKVYGR